MQHSPSPNPNQLLYSRRQAAQILGCHIATLIRLELAGRLRAVKLGGGPNASTYYRVVDIEQLAQPEG